MEFNEDSRVKIPGLLHFLRLGYTYQSKKGQNIQKHNNIFVDVFKESMKEVNGREYSDEQIQDAIKEIESLTNNRKDKGQSFYNRLKAYSDHMKLLNLEKPEKNDFRVVSELPFVGEHDVKFRPDITILVNGIPLAFVEVKKPNNYNGIQAEFERMKNDRLSKDEFVAFFNQLQVLGFTNNQPYDDASRTKKQGSYYTTPNGNSCKYNHFREEQEIPVSDFIDEKDKAFLLKDINSEELAGTPEFEDNLQPDTHANRFITSVFSQDRLMFFIRYGIAYVDSPIDGFDKHIIRYPQYFALQALKKDIKNGMHRGVVWHTQGSGKTAFAYFATNVLRDYFRTVNNGTITKFYFVVDRLDLLTQATSEFEARGLTIAKIDSRDDFIKNIQSKAVIDRSKQKNAYLETMNVVNIQKFSDDSRVIPEADSAVQRIYFLDEVHRGYRVDGKFLANLLGADKDGIFIGLTGTPIITTVKSKDGKEKECLQKHFKTTDLFSKYIHKYYYNKSIADGYTLKIRKEKIDTKFRNDIRAMMGIPEDKEIPSEKWEQVMESSEYINPLCKYIVDDFETFKETFHDNSFGFMIAAATTKHAQLIHEWFEKNFSLRTALVIDKESDNKEKQEYFIGKRDPRTGKTTIKYDGVIVLNMLLTGFNAPRLKKLYLLRTITKHNLLQALARVNRPYKNMEYGYVVDFVDITKEYEDINRRYLEELRADLEDEADSSDVNDFFVDIEAVKRKIADLENSLFIYMGNIEANLEAFRKQLEPLDEKTIRIINAQLDEYVSCYNELRMAHEDTSNMPIKRIEIARREASRRVSLLYAERMLDSGDEESEDIDFTNLIVEFLKNGEIDLEFSSEDDVMEILTTFNNARHTNTDKKDPAYHDIYGRYKKLIKEFKTEGDTTAKTKKYIEGTKALIKEMQILNDTNNSLVSRYNGSKEYMRIHKRLRERFSSIFSGDAIIYNFMSSVIASINDKLDHHGKVSRNVAEQALRRPVRDALVSQGINDFAPRQVQLIVDVISCEKYSE